MNKSLPRLSKKKLEAMAEEATVDCYNESEQATGWATMIEENLRLPFETQILGVPVSVEKVDITDRDELVAICRRGKYRQQVPLLNLPIPSQPPLGAEWIEAYRRWSKGS
jgi:hypothetical protein